MISTTTSEITGCTHDRPDKIYLDEHVTDSAHVRPEKKLSDDFDESSDSQSDECDTHLFPLKA